MAHRIQFEKEVPRSLGATTTPDSHVEANPGTFHASQLPYCRRQAYLRKFGLVDQSRVLGRFRTGDMIHERLAQWFETRYPHLEFERPVRLRVDDDITIVGHVDCYDPREEVVYEFKTRANWYRLNRPVDRHRDQVESYLRGLEADHGQIVYVSKSDLEIRFDPQLFSDDVRAAVVNRSPLRVAFVDDDTGELLTDQPEASEPAFFSPDDERFFNLVEKARDIRDAVVDEGIASTPEEIPFEKCDCWFCDSERLAFADTPSLETGTSDHAKADD